MIRTNLEIENYVFPLSKTLNLEGEPKWVFLRFMLNISLSVKKGFEEKEFDAADGKEYRGEQQQSQNQSKTDGN